MGDSDMLYTKWKSQLKSLRTVSLYLYDILDKTKLQDRK